jgi:hypothetical protein
MVKIAITATAMAVLLLSVFMVQYLFSPTPFRRLRVPVDSHIEGGRSGERLLPDSPYRGGRTLSWLKVKQQDYRVEERGRDARK